MDPIRIVAFGDSVVYGRHDSQGGWVGRLRQTLEDSNRWAGVFNLGIGGEDSADLLARIHEVKPRTPNIVVIGCGLNDLRIRRSTGISQVPLEIFQKNIALLIEQVRADPDRRIFLATMNPIQPSDHAMDGFWYSLENWRMYNDSLRRLSKACGVEVVDFAMLERFTQQTGALADEIHPSSLGHARMAEFAAMTIATAWK